MNKMKLFTGQSKLLIKESSLNQNDLHKMNISKNYTKLQFFHSIYCLCFAVVICILKCNSDLQSSSFSVGLSFFPKMATPTSATFTMRLRCTCCVWGCRSCWVRGRCSRGSAAPRRMNRSGLSASRWFCSGPEPSWTRASMREPMSMPQTIKRAPACTTRRQLAWRTVLR